MAFYKGVVMNTASQNKLYQMFLIFSLICSWHLSATTVNITEKVSGCAELNGLWSSETNTCTMTQSFEGHINIQNINDFTLDGSNFNLISPPDAFWLSLITLDQTTNVTIENLNILSTDNQNYGNALLLTNSVNNIISNVTISNAFHGALNLSNSHANLIENNTLNIPENGSGITMRFSTQNVISANYFTPQNNALNEKGILFNAQSDNNEVMHNTFESIGMPLYSVSSIDNAIYRNNFKDFIELYFSDGSFELGKPLPLAGNYYSSFDETTEGCNDTNKDLICDNSYAPYDLLPWVDENAWVTPTPPPEAEQEIIANTGGTVANSENTLVFNVPANSLAQDTTIIVESSAIEDAEIMIGNGAGTAVVLYSFGPEGTTFTPAATLTLVVDTTSLSENQIAALGIYLYDELSQTFQLLPDSSCVNDNLLMSATCQASIAHFSTYGVAFANDSDGDGIADSLDNCPSEDASSADANQDGCLDNVNELINMVILGVETGDIAKQMQTPFTKKLQHAMRLIEDQAFCDAKEKIISFNAHLKAQKGKKVTEGYADILLTYADGLLNSLNCD